MALSLAVAAGSRIQVGESILTVLRTARGRHIQIDVDGKEFYLTDQERVKILPEVFVSYGSPYAELSEFQGLRIAFEAPRSIKITRLDRATV